MIGAVTVWLASSKATFGSLSPIAMGVHFIDYLYNFRVEKSLQSLENSGKSIKEIAFGFSYRSVNTTSVCSRNIREPSPGQYKTGHVKDKIEAGCRPQPKTNKLTSTTARAITEKCPLLYAAPHRGCGSPVLEPAIDS
jgi:hypothetical protein